MCLFPRVLLCKSWGQGRIEVYTGCLLQSLSTLFLETGAHTEAGACGFGFPGWATLGCSRQQLQLFRWCWGSELRCTSSHHKPLTESPRKSLKSENWRDSSFTIFQILKGRKELSDHQPAPGVGGRLFSTLSKNMSQAVLHVKRKMLRLY